MSGNNPEIFKVIKPKTNEQIKQEQIEKQEISKKIAVNDLALEAELLSFNKIEDNLINPSTGNVMCVIRRPTMAQWEAFVPPELTIYKNPEDVPPEIAQKYNDIMFDMMSQIIVKPKHDAKWWKENATQDFIAILQEHLTNIMNRAGDISKKF